MNAWTEFQNLFKTTRKWVGKIDSINTGSNKIIVEIPGTIKTVEVEGPTSEYSAGDFVFIENNTIIAKAPDLRTVAEELIS